ncbi:MAG: hypothetical protein RJB10_1884 [Pseudomonadota bacterium]
MDRDLVALLGFVMMFSMMAGLIPSDSMARPSPMNVPTMRDV